MLATGTSSNARFQNAVADMTLAWFFPHIPDRCKNLPESLPEKQAYVVMLI